MRPQDIHACIVRIEGTNNEDEMYRAFKNVGATPHLVHLNELKTLDPYQCIMIPGGFSAGDYVRAGAIFASRIRSRLFDELLDFVDHGYPVGGICNGFQVLVELGLLPGDGEPGEVTACLAENDSARFECRHSLLLRTPSNPCAFTSRLPEEERLMVPSAHAEGKLLLAGGVRAYKRLEERGQVLFKYVNYANETEAPYPWNPNGSPHNIAGICNEKGNVFGMMPHPERAFDVENENGYAGRTLFESLIRYIGETF